MTGLNTQKADAEHLYDRDVFLICHTIYRMCWTQREQEVLQCCLASFFAPSSAVSTWDIRLFLICPKSARSVNLEACPSLRYLRGHPPVLA
jgi:hypothetical protein